LLGRVVNQSSRERLFSIIILTYFGANAGAKRINIHACLSQWNADELARTVFITKGIVNTAADSFHHDRLAGWHIDIATIDG
jgi:hypothetical protein